MHHGTARTAAPDNRSLSRRSRADMAPLSASACPTVMHARASHRSVGVLPPHSFWKEIIIHHWRVAAAIRLCSLGICNKYPNPIDSIRAEAGWDSCHLLGLDANRTPRDSISQQPRMRHFGPHGPPPTLAPITIFSIIPKVRHVRHRLIRMENLQ